MSCCAIVVITILCLMIISVFSNGQVESNGLSPDIVSSFRLNFDNADVVDYKPDRLNASKAMLKAESSDLSVVDGVDIPDDYFPFTKDGFVNRSAYEWNELDYPIKTMNNIDMTHEFPQTKKVPDIPASVYEKLYGRDINI